MLKTQIFFYYAIRNMISRQQLWSLNCSFLLYVFHEREINEIPSEREKKGKIELNLFFNLETMLSRFDVTVRRERGKC